MTIGIIILTSIHVYLGFVLWLCPQHVKTSCVLTYLSLHMASKQDSNTEHTASSQKTLRRKLRISQKHEQPPIPLRRLAVRIYQYLKPRMNRSRLEHILFSETVSIIDQLNPTERAALIATRETRSGRKPEPPSTKELVKFTEMREAFLNWSSKRLRSPMAET